MLRRQNASQYCLLVQTIDISEAWALPSFGFQSQVTTLDCQDLVTSRTSCKRNQMAFGFFSLFSIEQHDKRGEQSIP